MTLGGKEMNSTVTELKHLRDHRHVFRDRGEAGRMVGRMLTSAAEPLGEAMVLAIPAGGVPVGMEVKEMLGLAFDLMIVRKLQIPDNPEAGFGAMTLDGTVFTNDRLMAQLGLTQAETDAAKNRVHRELERRNTPFRGGRPFPDLTGRDVILVDDGLASGFTMLAYIAMAKKAKAVKTIVAVPKAPQRTIDRLAAEVDGIYCPNIRTTTRPIFIFNLRFHHAGAVRDRSHPDGCTWSRNKGLTPFSSSSSHLISGYR